MRDIAKLDIKRAICGLITVAETNLGLEVSTPVMYPNGDMATVVIAQEGAKLLIHDAGLGALHLNKHGMKINRAVRSRIEEAVGRYGCQFVTNRVTRRTSTEYLGLAALTVANASRAVADEAVEIRRSLETDFREAVLSNLRDMVGNRVRENETIKGKSGRSYRVSALILDRSEKNPLAFVSAISSRVTIPSHLTEFFDLKNAFDGVFREAIYDDASDLREEDRILMAQVADLVPFSQVRLRLGAVFNA